MSRARLSSHLWKVTTIGRYRGQHSQSHTDLHKKVFPTPLQAKPLQTQKTFENLPIHPLIKSALTATGKIKPTKIQTLSIPPILDSKHTLIAAETGSGKTLAYLIPLLSSLKAREAGANSPSSKHWHDDDSFSLQALSTRPSILVLQPTRELADQALRVSKALSHVAKFRVRAATGGPRRRTLDKRLTSSAVDVLIATPGAVLRLREANKLFLSNLRTIVLDEADELLEAQHGHKNDDNSPAEAHRHFAQQLGPVLSAVGKRNVQFVYVAATVPARLERWAMERHADAGFQVVRGERLHKAQSSRRLKVFFVRVDGSEGVDDVKFRKVVEIITMALKRANSGKMLVFCDGFERRASVVERLQQSKVNAVHLGGGGVNAWKRDEDWEKFRKNEVRVAVCARSFARGIDDEEIRTVVMMDVPFTGGEYLHRVGRIRQEGRVYVLVGAKEERIAEALFLGHVKGEAVAGVDAKAAWKDHVDSSSDRIEQDWHIRRARKEDQARWVDERSSKVGSFRGRYGSRKSLPS